MVENEMKKNLGIYSRLTTKHAVHHARILNEIIPSMNFIGIVIESKTDNDNFSCFEYQFLIFLFLLNKQ